MLITSQRSCRNCESRSDRLAASAGRRVVRSRPARPAYHPGTFILWDYWRSGRCRVAAAAYRRHLM